ncbi:MAG: hypothetical protein JSS66_03480 [Armatimonadetes bacterium]|nr:hypothetical protein [Armatimonadota bacterium]
MIRGWGSPSNHDALRRKFNAGVLKVCPLCGTLNVDEAEECFVCWWHGEFDSNPVHVEIKVAELVARCPELHGMLTGPVSIGDRLRFFWRRAVLRFRSRLDVTA